MPVRKTDLVEGEVRKKEERRKGRGRRKRPMSISAENCTQVQKYQKKREKKVRAARRPVRERMFLARKKMVRTVMMAVARASVGSVSSCQ